jgi:UDPglucose 6-dehydrogenase
MGGDINDVRRGIGHDSRIGFAFLFPGVGYGGSCFPKDVRALVSMTRDKGLEPRMLEAVDAVNEQQKHVQSAKLSQHFDGNLSGKKIAVWGLAFKPRTDDIREAPALVLIDWLLAQGAEVRVHDPEAMDNVRAELGDKVTYCARRMDAAKGADALCIMTEWKDYHSPDFADLKQQMASPVIFDGRNLYDTQLMHKLGFTYHSIGRQVV